MIGRGKGIFCAVLAVLLAGAGHAADANGRSAIHGDIPHMTCGAFMKSLGDDGIRDRFVAWTLGYASGINVLTEDTYDYVGDRAAFTDMILAECKAKPELLVALAVNNALTRRYETRIRRAP